MTALTSTLVGKCSTKDCRVPHPFRFLERVRVFAAGLPHRPPIGMADGLQPQRAQKTNPRTLSWNSERMRHPADQ